MLDGALRLLDGQPISELTVAAIAASAAVAKGTFYVHFPSVEEFLLALHEHFHDRVFAEIEQATANLPPGEQRLRARLTAFHDACRSTAGARSTLRASAAHPALVDASARRNGQAARAVAEDLRALGVERRAGERAALIVAAATEAAAREGREAHSRGVYLRALLDLACPRDASRRNRT